jgi:hypothetical protein
MCRHCDWRVRHGYHGPCLECASRPDLLQMRKQGRPVSDAPEDALPEIADAGLYQQVTPEQVRELAEIQRRALVVAVQSSAVLNGIAARYRMQVRHDA